MLLTRGILVAATDRKAARKIPSRINLLDIFALVKRNLPFRFGKKIATPGGITSLMEVARQLSFFIGQGMPPADSC